jgi:SAM-dependent methyltransferase
MANEEAPRFGFGRNWEQFVDRHFSQDRLRIARDHLLSFLRVPDLAGKRMIDIGCGSGLHSVAALSANVAELVSFDYDPDSVATTRRLSILVGQPAHWRIEQGSILDDDYVSRLGQFDIVLAWGVLHHTGDQWKAIKNAASLIAPSGVFYLALYTSDIFVDPPPEFWLDVKRRYNRSGSVGKRRLEAWYMIQHLVGLLKDGQNPLTFVWNYERSRGMSYYTDVKDWLGGWPMEFSSIEEVKRFGREELKLDLARIVTGEANTEYLFRKVSQ